MITTNAVENIENLFISTTESGSQDGRSCYEVYKFFNHVIDDNKKPVVVLTDGHSSRFNVDVLRTCRDEKLRQYLGPPGSTHVTQLHFIDPIIQVQKSYLKMKPLTDMDF